jgi:hypothetical protein
MHLSIIKTVFTTLILGVFAGLFGQTPDAAVKPSYFAGDIASINAGSIVITTKAGPKEIVLTEKTAFKRASAEDFNLATATTGTLTDISVGDKATVSALLAADGRSMNARTVYFVTKADISQKRSKDSERWKTRGIFGKVASVNVSTNQITVDIPRPMGKTVVTVTLQQDAKVLRYSDDSIMFSDARKSNLSEIKPGDQISVLGNKGEDGTTLNAEAIVTGTFLQLPGTVKFVDRTQNEVVIKDSKGKDVTVALSGAIMLKRFPPEIAERMAARSNGGFRPRTGQGQQSPSTTQAQPVQGSTNMPGGSRGGGIEEMLERLPNITVADLKPGEQIGLLILVSGTAPKVGDHIKAIKLIAGIEPFLRMQTASPGANRQGVQGGFTIPGLDGSGF